MKIAVIISRNKNSRTENNSKKIFCGKPIIAYPIEAAISSGLFDDVIVLTQDEDIVSISQQYGAKVSNTIDKEYVDCCDILDELICVLSKYKKNGVCPDKVCCIYSTVPFVTKEKLNTANRIMDKNKANAVVSVVKYSFPPQRGRVIDKDYLKYKWPENILKRSQDLEPLYYDAKQFYLYNVEAVINEHTVIPQKSIPYIQKETEVQDIESNDDWKVAEIKYMEMIKNNDGLGE